MNIAVILSGGTGSRMGLDKPKQYIEIAGKPILNYCLSIFIDSDKIDAIVIVRADEWKDYVWRNVNRLHPSKPVYYAEPGETRQYSIYNALRVVKEHYYRDDDIVIIHDAARPLVSNKLIESCIKACENADGVMPVIACKDTVYLSEDGEHIKALLNRDKLWNGQAPEAFRLRKYLEAHEAMSQEELLKINGSTELAFKAGLKCRMIAGDPMNFKITTMEDLDTFKSIITKQTCK